MRYKSLFILPLLAFWIFIPLTAKAVDLHRCIYVGTGACGGSWPEKKDVSECIWQADEVSGENCCTNGNSSFLFSKAACADNTNGYKTIAPKSSCVTNTCCCPPASMAASSTSNLCPAAETFIPQNLSFAPQVTIPGSDFVEGKPYTLKNDTSPIAQYIKSYYQYGLGIVGIVAAIVLMLGGIIWLTAAGSSSKIEQAKDMITSSLVGMFILFGSWIILRTINPDLVNLKTTSVNMIEKPACCEYTDHDSGAKKAGMFYPSICVGADVGGRTFKDKIANDALTQCVDGGCCLRMTKELRPVTMVVKPWKGLTSAIGLLFGNKQAANGIYEMTFDAWDSTPESCSPKTVSDISLGWAALSALTAGLTATDVGYEDVFLPNKCVDMMCCVGKTDGSMCLSSDRAPGKCASGLCSTTD